MNCREFIMSLSSKSPVPGGGGASALIGSIGMALGNMVASLTIGKKRYAEVEEEMIALQKRGLELQEELLQLVDRDADVFEPLSRAYGLPKNTEEETAYKQQVMEKALKDASDVPIKIMECCCEAIKLASAFSRKGSRIAVSDAGVSAAVLGAALRGAALNVFINTRSMKDRDRAEELNRKAEEMLALYSEQADQVYHLVASELCKR